MSATYRLRCLHSNQSVNPSQDGAAEFRRRPGTSAQIVLLFTFLHSFAFYLYYLLFVLHIIALSMDLTYISLLVIFCIIVYVMNKKS